LDAFSRLYFGPLDEDFEVVKRFRFFAQAIHEDFSGCVIDPCDEVVVPFVRSGWDLATQVRVYAAKDCVGSRFRCLLDFGSGLFPLEAGFTWGGKWLPRCDFDATDDAFSDHALDGIRVQVAEPSVPGIEIGFRGWCPS
jgi:hypothetical protein